MHVGTKLPREDLLALDPEEALREGLCTLEGEERTSLRQDLATTAAFALAEQARIGKVPIETIEACLAAIEEVRGLVKKGGGWRIEHAAELARRLGMQVAGLAALGRWTTAIARRVKGERDLEAALRLLERARVAWIEGRPH